MTKTKQQADLAIFGGGILGLAHAYMAVKRGFSVVLFEPSEYTVGVSIRNFGLIWPVGYKPGNNFNRAIESKAYWESLSTDVGFWYANKGSLQLACNEEEWQVLCEFHETFSQISGYDLHLLPSNRLNEVSPYVNAESFMGGLYSTTEATLNPREIVRKFPTWLQENCPITFRYGNNPEIQFPYINTPVESWRVGNVLVCSETDFMNLYPDEYRKKKLGYARFQMMKAVSSEHPYDLGPTLCSGLVWDQFASFNECSSMANLRAGYAIEKSREGMHMTLLQNNRGELIFDGTHFDEVMPEVDPNSALSASLLNRMKAYIQLDGFSISEKWHGRYPIPKEVTEEWVFHPEHGVMVINMAGVHEMTLCFGLAREVIELVASKMALLSP